MLRRPYQRRSRRICISTAAMAAVLVGCGSTAPSAASPTVEVNAPTDQTVAPPPRPVPPTFEPTSTTEMSGEIDHSETSTRITSPIDANDGSPSLTEMKASSSIIIVGTVTETVSLGRPGLDEDPHANEYVGLTITVDRVLSDADPTADVRLAWNAFAIGADGERFGDTVINGLRAPADDDQMILFLRKVDEVYASRLGGFPTHVPIALDGIAYLEQGVVAETEAGAPAWTSLIGSTVDEVAAALSKS
jgi:hypothetical protein